MPRARTAGGMSMVDTLGRDVPPREDRTLTIGELAATDCSQPLSRFSVRSHFSRPVLGRDVPEGRACRGVLVLAQLHELQYLGLQPEHGAGGVPDQRVVRPPRVRLHRGDARQVDRHRLTGRAGLWRVATLVAAAELELLEA